MAQIADLTTKEFYIHYYSIGTGDDCRLASYFILDADKKPKLPGAFDCSAPVPLKSVEEFFELTAWNKRLARRAWDQATTAFMTMHHFKISFKQRDGDGEYIGADVRSELHRYPKGQLIGGIPFGAETIFLAICKLDKRRPAIWKKAFESHKDLYGAWNAICHRGSKLTRVYVEGEPGSGKELWVDAIQLGSSPHRDSEKWQRLSATLPVEDLKLLLYGERNGALERPGFLASCSGGGVFLDEIGKSDPTFRKDLLRVLEAGEFVPVGGLPTKIKNVLFVFASTKGDRQSKTAADPPDFWTRIDAWLSLPEPIKLKRPTLLARRANPFGQYDAARFHALLSHFWLKALTVKDVTVESEILAEFGVKVLNPILRDLGIAARREWPRELKEISVSARRVRTLAENLAPEHRWIGYTIPEEASERSSRKTATKSYEEFRRNLVDRFFNQLVQDERNVRKKGPEREDGAIHR